MNADEICQVVNEKDEETGKATRQEIRTNNLIHRCTYVFLKNSRNKFWVHKRTMLKSWCPGHWDCCFGGVVQYQEPYELNAERELMEEAGVKCPLQFCFKLYFQNQKSKTWGACYIGNHDGPLTLQKEEVELVEEMSQEEIRERVKKGELFAPDSLMAFDKLMEQQGKDSK